MKRIVELIFFCLIAAIVGFATNKVSTEITLLRTYQQITAQNHHLCMDINKRNQMLLGLQEANLNLKTSLDESVALVSTLTIQIEELSRDIDRLEYLVESKERTIKSLEETVAELRKIIKSGEPNDTNNSVPVEAP
jgi:peptidoglycan hydrolase CwlO-like protein